MFVQVEIDEYRDYEKALSALREALKYMVKARAQNKEERCKQLQQKIYLVDRFVEARKVVKTDPNEMVKISHQLLEQPDVEQTSVCFRFASTTSVSSSALPSPGLLCVSNAFVAD